MSRHLPAAPTPRRRGGLLLILTVGVALSASGPENALVQGAARAGEPSARAAGLPAISTAVAFPGLSFDRPVALAQTPDDPNRYFVVEQHQAKIWSFANQRDATDKQLFLQLPHPINRGNEEGLLGLAFHPHYKNNGWFFVYYSADDDGTRRSVVSRFQVSADDPLKADPASERRIWVSDVDGWENHNGGTILFGPDDGHLYITLGDGGAAADPLSTGQNPKDWFGSILRIDVDNPSDGRAYGIPKDNPKLRSRAHAHWAPEVYCIGLRNVWKFSFDRETGELWAGDVGQDLWEMVHKIDNGGNYGWSIREGFHPFQPQRRQRPDPASKIRPPIAEYPHNASQGRSDTGLSITGGYVYRGEAIPELKGYYVYGDFETGRIWGLTRENDKVTAEGEILNLKSSPKLNIASFAETPEGELLILAFDGRIHQVVPASR